MWGTEVSKRGDIAKGRENRSGVARGDSKMEQDEEEGERRVHGGRRRASIHIHPEVATGTLITCFNLPTADWASICHSKSVIARGATPLPDPVVRGSTSLCIAIASLLVV